MRRAIFALLLAAGVSSAAEAALLTCAPEPGRLQIEIVAFGRGDRLPDGLETLVAFVRAGADQYEIYTEHMTTAALRDDVLRVEAQRPLSAGEAAMLVIDGKAAANGIEFSAAVTFRAEGRVMLGTVRCKLI